MKKAILALGLLASVSSFAQVNGNILSVCEDMRIRTTYSDRITQCVQLVSRNTYDTNLIGLLKALNQKSTQETLNALNVTANNRYDINAIATCAEINSRTTYTDRVTECLRTTANLYYAQPVAALAIAVASKATTETNNILKVAGNASFDANAVRVCSEINNRTTYTDRVTSCVRTIANNSYAPEVVELAIRVASKATTESNNIMVAAANAYFMPSAVAACEEINNRTTYTDRVTSCVNTIKNKVFMNGTDTFCKQMAANSTTEAIKCLATSAMDYIPAPIPVPRDIIVSQEEIRSLKRDLIKTRNQVERGMTAQALRSIDEALRSIETMEAR